MNIRNKLMPLRKKVSLSQPLLQIFWTFFKISPISFGGGYALIPVIEREIVTNRRWLNKQELSDALALAQTAPGTIAINSAIFIGFRLKKGAGAIAAIVGILLPTFFIMIALTILLQNIHDAPKIEAAFQAIRTSIVALIAYAAYKLGKESIIDYTSAIIAATTIALLYFAGHLIHPLFLIAGGAIAGIINGYVKQALRKHKPEPEPEKPSKHEPSSSDAYSDYMI